MSLCAIGFGRRVVDVGVGRDEEVFGVRPRNGLGVELAAVHDLDAVDQPFAVGRDLEFGVFETFTAPARVVVHHQRPLRLGVAQRLQGVGGVDRIVVGGEKRVVVTVGDRFAGDFRARNDRDAVLRGRLLRQLYREVQVGPDSLLVGRFGDDVVIDRFGAFRNVTFEEVEHLALVAAVLHVFGDGQHVQTVVPRFADAEFGRAVAVRVDRMGVQVGLVDGVAAHFGQYELDALRGDAQRVARDVGIGGVGVVVLSGRGERRRQGSAEEEKFFHGIVVMGCPLQR